MEFKVGVVIRKTNKQPRIYVFFWQFIGRIYIEA